MAFDPTCRFSTGNDLRRLYPVWFVLLRWPPLHGSHSQQGSTIAAAAPDVIRAVGAILIEYRDPLEEIIDRAALPHDLPPAREALAAIGFRQATGPKKPVLGIRADVRQPYTFQQCQVSRR